MADGAGCELFNCRDDVDFIGVEGIVGAKFERLVEA